MGYKNAAVFGGFSTFVIKCLNMIYDLAKRQMSEEDLGEIPRLNMLLKRYVDCDPKDRELIVQDVLKLAGKLSMPENGEMQSTSESGEMQSTPEKKAGTDGTAKKNQVAGAKKKTRAAVEIGSAPGKTQPGTKPDAGDLLELQFLKNVGPKRIRLLKKLGINSVRDLLYHFPRRYEDRSRLKKFYQIQDGEVETVTGRVIGCQDLKPRKGLHITKAAVNDGTSVGYAVWFNQPFIKKQIPPGTEILITGKADRKFGSIQITVTDFEIADQEDPVHTGRIVPVYPATEGLPAKTLRTIMKSAVDKYAIMQEEFLPPQLLAKYGFIGLPAALAQIHFPGVMDEIEAARHRLVFEELFLLQMGVGLLKVTKTAEKGIKHKKPGPLTKLFQDQIPFGLTGAQKRVLDEIVRDMEDEKPMNRLVQGDVGSGKTIIAAAALVKTVESGYQGAMMAPTEILASQHYQGLQELLEPLGVRLALLTGSLSRSEKAATLDDIKNGRVDIVVGTHAVIQEEIEFQRLGLAVTDEQHRFGVKQRAKLKEKGYNPDVLVMTATPIPRTLALTIYGDLDVSVIDELPPGRQPIKTHWTGRGMKSKVYKFIRDQVNLGRQVYYICPLVEESDKLEVQAAVELAEILQNRVFPDIKVGLMHGRLKQDEKDTVMRDFKNGELNILVATTVVEVGVNVPNATVIVIEDADRFGLAQLHQLRGRVGRGSFQSYCILVASPSTEEGKARMKIMQSTCDGFVIAEEDLKLRGPGEFFGTRQSGLPDLKIADLIKDVKTMQLAREEALKLLKSDPGLEKKEHLRLKEEISGRFLGTANYIKTS